MLMVNQLCFKVIVCMVCIIVEKMFPVLKPTVLEARGLLGRECRPCDSYVKVGQIITYTVDILIV